MHAVLVKANSSANPKGDKRYTIAFSYPRGYLSYMDKALGEECDIYWNEELVAVNAFLTGCTQKPVKDADPIYTATFDCDAADTSRANLLDQVNESGDLRLVIKQLSLSI